VLASSPAPGNEGTRPRRPFAAGIDELPEVLVLRQQNTTFVACQTDHLRVLRTTGNLRHGQDVMAGGSQRTHDGEVATFVGEEAHGFPFRI